MRDATLIAIITILGAGAVAPVWAQGSVKLKDRHLDRVDWYHSRPIVEILPAGPIIKDRRLQESNQTFVINVGPPPQSAPGVPIVVNAGNMTGGSGIHPSQVVVSQSASAPSRFGSNIPAGGTGHNASLPDGSSTSLLGRMKYLQQPAARQPVNKVVNNPGAAKHSMPVAPVLLSYPRPASFSASDNTTSDARVDIYGKIQRRGDMLK